MICASGNPQLVILFSTHCCNLFSSHRKHRLGLLLSHILALCQYVLNPVVTEAESQFLLTLCSLILEVFLVLSAFAYSSNQIYPYFS